MLSNLREHRTRQFLCLFARVMIGEHMCRELADRRAGMFARVMLCKRGAREFFFYRRRVSSPEYDGGEMRDAVRCRFVVQCQFRLPCEWMLVERAGSRHATDIFFLLAAR
jgi:hypothetical protein